VDPPPPSPPPAAPSEPSELAEPDDPEDGRVVEEVRLALDLAEVRFLAAERLAGAFRGVVDPAGLDAMDAGASTGGFTDVLLRRGAARVVAVDVGYGQLAWSLREDPRVTVMERTNVRDVRPPDLPFEPALVVADLSFISLRVALPPLAALAAPGAAFVLLVKPQFEVGPDRVGSGGVVRDPGAWLAAMEGVRDALTGLGRTATQAMASPMRGPAGNVEFLVLAGSGDGAADLEAAVAEGLAVRDGSRV